MYVYKFCPLDLWTNASLQIKKLSSHGGLGYLVFNWCPSFCNLHTALGHRLLSKFWAWGYQHAQLFVTISRRRKMIYARCIKDIKKKWGPFLLLACSGFFSRAHSFSYCDYSHGGGHKYGERNSFLPFLFVILFSSWIYRWMMHASHLLPSNTIWFRR